MRTARRWLDAPWRHQGRTPRGLDCVGLLAITATHLRVPHHDVRAYSRRPGDSREFLGHFRAAGCVEIPVGSAMPGDILIFADNHYPCHCAIVSERRGAPHIIHSHASWRRVVEQPLDPDWMSRRTHAFRFPGVID